MAQGQGKEPTVIRVLLVAPSEDIVGGQSIQAGRIRREMTKVPQVAMKFLPINQRFPAPLRWAHRVRYLRTTVNFIHYMLMLAVRAASADVLHIFTASFWSYTLWSMPAILVGKLYGKQVILNYRDGRCEDHLRNWRTAIPTIRLADAVVAPSGYLVDVFGRYGIAAESIPNFLDTSRFRYRKRGPVRPALMTNRGLETLYNIPCILRAFALIQQRYPEATLTIAHDGPLRAELEEMAAGLGLRHTQFLGSVPQEKIPSLYDQAEIYVTTPNIDCMPGSLLECMASGLPIVATHAGGIPYIVKDQQTALLVDMEDHEGVARCCLRLLEDPDLVQRLTQAAYEAVQEYAPEHSLNKWVALYRRLVERNP